ncbi:MAG: CDP-alcohol phosphatidyltransferase family protein [Solirubrobacterales bacterium]
MTQRLFFLAGIAFILGSVMDTLDGRYSRMSGKGTLFGALLDPTLDRVEEDVLAPPSPGYFAARGEDPAAAMAGGGAGQLSMVSCWPWPSGRGAGGGVQGRPATRPVRVVLLSIGLVFAKGAGIGDFELLAPAIHVIAALEHVTVIQRVWHVRNELSGETPDVHSGGGEAGEL